MTLWTPTHWQTLPQLQHVDYPDVAHLAKTVAQLSTLPPLVTTAEVDRLRQQLGRAARGESFILQGGDCAESLAECHSENITNKLKIILQMSLILIHGLRKPVIRVGRVAGQYAKPRSSPEETQGGKTLPSYRGDMINLAEFSDSARTPNPELMRQCYYHAASSLNYIRALIDGGFANLQHPENWNIDFVHHSPLEAQYQHIVNTIGDTIAFIKTLGAVKTARLNQIEFYTSHEALHLPYEQAMTRPAENGQWYNLGTHFPWLGMRTAHIDHAHVDYLRGIQNPVAIKVGPKASTQWLTEIIHLLNPDNLAGRLTLITRLGHREIGTLLPPLIDAAKKTNKVVTWSCDPMHGNTQKTQQGYKTRSFDDILSELSQTFRCHQQAGTHLGGVHFELTGDDVTECIGGARGLSEKDLQRAYKTLVDPRLNYEQSLEMAMLLAKALSNVTLHTP